MTIEKRMMSFPRKGQLELIILLGILLGVVMRVAAACEDVHFLFEPSNDDDSPDHSEQGAEDRLIEMLESYLPAERFALLHTNARKEAFAFFERIKNLVAGKELYSMDITPVIGAHLGPGAVGYAIVSMEPV